jgi:hypothetical protein
LPHGEFGLEVIDLIGAWRFREHRGVPEMHQAILVRDISIIIPDMEVKYV